MRLAIRFSGAGGQGIALAGLIMAEAAVASGRRVACTQAYGPESRGGASRSDVIISDAPIAYPAARQTDLLVALTQEACEKSWRALRPEGIAIVDGGGVSPPGRGPAECHALPLQQTARAVAGTAIATNIVALGAVCGLLDLLPLDALRAAVARRVPAASRDLNLRALEAGVHLGAAARGTGTRLPGGVA